MAYSDGVYHTQIGRLFAEAVGVCTGGALTITVHAGGSLYEGNEIKRAVQTGQAQIGERLLSAHQDSQPIFGVDTVPFLAASFEAASRLRAAARPELEAALATDNLVYLYAVPWPPQGLYAKGPVETAADLSGQKFRIYNVMTARIAEIADMVPTRVAPAELNEALAEGQVDLIMSSASTGFDRKMWEEASHFYDLQAWLPMNTVFVNQNDFDRLPEQSQNCLRSAALLAEEAGTARAGELTGWYLAQLAANGMAVEPPSEELATATAEIGRLMLEEWRSTVGEAADRILDAYQAGR
jgi:TRAP-type C4-dicarboxylate transport system substrate-binding protein